MYRRSSTVLLIVLTVAAVSFGAMAPSMVARAGPLDQEEVVLTLFWGDGCPHCAAEHEFLDELRTRYPQLTVDAYEVWYDDANRALFVDRAAAAGFEAASVPTTFLGDEVWIGFSDGIGREIEAAVVALSEGAVPPEPERSTIDVPFVGDVDLGGRSLLLSTVLIGFVDGVNPCSLWVLSVLLAMVLHSGSRRRVIVVGGVFLVITSAMYGLYIVGIYNALSYVEVLPWMRAMVAGVAGVLGVLQLKDFVAFHRGPSLGVPDRAKPGMYGRMRRVAAPERPWPIVLGATAVLAVGVSLLETPCTLGLPVLWTSMLARNDVPAAGAVVLFVVYLTVFLLDELALFAAVVVTMRAVKLQERHGRELKLISGVTMVTLALVMVIRPSTMETLGGAMAVFGAAAGVAIGSLAVDRRVRDA